MVTPQSPLQPGQGCVEFRDAPPQHDDIILPTRLLLAGAVHRFRYLKYGLGLILVFVGLKMAWLNDAFGGKFPITWSLSIIGAILVGAMLASFFLLRPAPASRAQP